MKSRDAIVLGLIALVAVAACGFLLNARNEEHFSADVPWMGEEDSDDPFAEMIEEGAGLIGQMKAEAAELARRQGTETPRWTG